MTTNKNRLRLDYKDMPELKAALGGLQPGARGSIELSIMVSANSEDYLEADIEGVEYEIETEEGEEESGSAEPSAETPIMVEVVRSASRKTKPTEEETEEPMDDEE